MRTWTAHLFAMEWSGLVFAIALGAAVLAISSPAFLTEFNIYVDPEAARMVFQSGIPITMVGLDVTRKTALTDDHVRQLSAGKSPVSQAAARIASKAIDHNRSQGFLVGPNMHDSLALAAFLDPSILTFENYYVDVEVNGELTAGQTLGYSPNRGDLRRTPEMQAKAESSMVIRGAAPTLSGTRISPVLRDKYVPNTRVACNWILRVSLIS